MRIRVKEHKKFVTYCMASIYKTYMLQASRLKIVLKKGVTKCTPVQGTCTTFGATAPLRLSRRLKTGGARCCGTKVKNNGAKKKGGKKSGANSRHFCANQILHKSLIKIATYWTIKIPRCYNLKHEKPTVILRREKQTVAKQLFSTVGHIAGHLRHGT